MADAAAAAFGGPVPPSLTDTGLSRLELAMADRVIGADAAAVYDET